MMRTTNTGEAMKRARLVGTLLTMLVLASVPTIGAADPTVVAGTGRIACQLTLPGAQATNCAPLDPDNGQVSLASGDRAWVSFRVDWVANAASSEVLQVEIFGNTACQDDEAAGCHRRVAVGASPLTVHLAGTAASGSTVIGAVLSAPACIDLSCEPARLVADQGYAFTWTYE